MSSFLGTGKPKPAQKGYGLQFDGVSMVKLLDTPDIRKSFLVEYHGMGKCII